MFNFFGKSRNEVENPDNRGLKNLVLILAAFAVLIISGTLLHVFFGAITNYDSLTAHMARVMYYRQFGKVGYFGANYWAQDMHPYVLPFLQLTLIKLTNWENSAIFIQWFSLILTSIFSGLACYKISGNKFSAAIASLLTFFFVNAVVQATTTQNDLVLTAIISIQLYVSVSGISKSRKFLFLWFLFLLGLGVKQTFILYQLPILFSFLWHEKFDFKSLFLHIPVFRLFFLTILVGPLFLFHMIDCYRNIGSPFGFKDVLDSHSFLSSDFLFIIKAGSRNFIRYLFDFFTLDGLNAYPSISTYLLKIVNFFKWNVACIIKPLTGDLEKGSEIRVGFFYLKSFSVEDSSSFWGPLGPLLVFPFFLFSIISDFRKNQLESISIMGLCILFIFFTQSYSSLYDMWRGRYFNEAIPFASCLTAIFIQNNFANIYIRSWTIFGLILAGLGSFGAIYFRKNNAIITRKESTSLFSSSREDIMTGNNDELKRAIHFMTCLPSDVDSLGLFTSENMPEYILFDFQGKRKLFPMNSHGGKSPWKNLKVDAILFTDNIFKPSGGDRYISVFGVNGEKLYYRKINYIRK
jgi:hypothetical protein